MHYVFDKGETPTVLRESCWREATFQSLSAVSFLHILEKLLDIVSISYRSSNNHDLFCLYKTITYCNFYTVCEYRRRSCYLTLEYMNAERVSS